MTEIMQSFLFILLVGALYFVLELHIFNILFLSILTAMIVAFILSKKGVGDNRWRWIVLFAMLAFAILLSFIQGKWGRQLDSFSDAYYCCARLSTFLYLLEAGGTFIMWRRFRDL